MNTNNGPDHSAVSSPSAAAAPAAGSTYTVSQVDKFHGHVMKNDVYFYTAPIANCRLISDLMNRQEREYGQVAVQQTTKEK